MNEKLEKLIENVGDKVEGLGEKGIQRGFNFVSGIAGGTFDILTTGYPLVSLGCPFYNMLARSVSLPLAKALGINPSRLFDNKKKYYKEIAINNLAYFSGVLVPFSVKYSDEILNFISYLYDKI